MNTEGAPPRAVRNGCGRILVKELPMRPPVRPPVSLAVRVDPHRRGMTSSTASSTRSTCPASRAALTAPWDHEWQRLLHDPAASARVGEWADAHPVLAPYTDLAAVLHATGRGLALEQADEALAAVVQRAASDDVAAHVAMRRILPGLLRAAIRRGASGRWRVRPVFDDLTSTAWVLIRTFPVERRPRRIAVNLLRDAEYHVCVRPYRLRAGSELPVDVSECLAAQTPAADLTGRPLGRLTHASDELADVLAEGQRAGLTDEVALLAALYLEGEPVARAAERLGVSPRTILNRRLAATARLQHVAA